MAMDALRPAWPVDDPIACDRFAGGLTQAAAMRRLRAANAFVAGMDGGAFRVRAEASPWRVAALEGCVIRSLLDTRNGQVLSVAPPGWPVGALPRGEAELRLAEGSWRAVRTAAGDLVGIHRDATGQTLRVLRPDEEETRVEVALA